jgi:hypothetical protein
VAGDGSDPTRFVFISCVVTVGCYVHRCNKVRGNYHQLRFVCTAPMKLLLFMLVNMSSHENNVFKSDRTEITWPTNFLAVIQNQVVHAWQ